MFHIVDLHISLTITLFLAIAFCNDSQGIVLTTPMGLNHISAHLVEETLCMEVYSVNVSILAHG